MSLSQRALLAGIGFVAFLMIVGAVWSRLTVTAGPQISGERSTLTPALADFAGVEASGRWDLTVARGDTWRVELDVPLELVDRIEARVEDGRLVLGFEGWLGGCGDTDRCRMNAGITLPELREVHLSGATTVDFSGFDGERLTIETSGASEIDGSASRYDELDLTTSGAGDVDLDDVTVTNAEVSVSGAGSIALRMAGGRLTGGLSGAASLRYAGTVSEESVST
ncbi:MAG TPA: DUF2807 domain-containing protein, partial [Gammaproteobacteria bacterium]|nr:DUF2807 domain-containing protein [Gammaproteobacteria bacterium]